jgi:hypothetical protein
MRESQPYVTQAKQDRGEADLGHRRKLLVVTEKGNPGTGKEHRFRNKAH